MHLYKDVRKEQEFQKGYEKVIGRSFVITREDELRMELYRLYLDVIVYVESYRYEGNYGQKVRQTMIKAIEGRIEELESE